MDITIYPIDEPASLIIIKKQIATRDRRCFLVRIMPYRTLENRIDGVVINF